MNNNLIKHDGKFGGVIFSAKALSTETIANVYTAIHNERKSQSLGMALWVPFDKPLTGYVKGSLCAVKHSIEVVDIKSLTFTLSVELVDKGLTMATYVSHFEDATLVEADYLPVEIHKVVKPFIWKSHITVGAYYPLSSDCWLGVTNRGSFLFSLNGVLESPSLVANLI